MYKYKYNNNTGGMEFFFGVMEVGETIHPNMNSKLNTQKQNRNTAKQFYITNQIFGFKKNLALCLFVS